MIYEKLPEETPGQRSSKLGKYIFLKFNNYYNPRFKIHPRIKISINF
jgi:hypothetical protein